MKAFTQFGLYCLLAQGVFAGQHGGHAGGVTVGHHAAHLHGSIRTFGSGRYGGDGYGGFYEPSHDSGYYPSADPGSTTVVYPSSAPVIVTQTPHSVIHEYGQQEDYGTESGGEGQPILYLIAFRDTTIRAAMTYWIEDGTLHYLDTGHQAKQAPLSSVDRDMSARLNRERHVPFNIP